MIAINSCKQKFGESCSLMAWLWLFRIPGQAKAVMEPSFWPGLAWLTASGWAKHSTRAILSPHFSPLPLLPSQLAQTSDKRSSGLLFTSPFTSTSHAISLSPDELQALVLANFSTVAPSDDGKKGLRCTGKFFFSLFLIVLKIIYYLDTHMASITSPFTTTSLAISSSPDE